MHLEYVTNAVNRRALRVLKQQALAGRQATAVSNPRLDYHIAGHIT